MSAHKHTASTGLTTWSNWLYCTLNDLGIRHYYCFWLRRGSHAAWKQMGAILTMTDTAPAEAWNIQPDLGKNTLICFKWVKLLGKHLYLASQALEQLVFTTQECLYSAIIFAQVCYSTTQSFTCRLIQTSDIVIEWSPLNGLNLYNTERETGREGGGLVKLIIGKQMYRPESTRQTKAIVSRLEWETNQCVC